MAKNTKIEWVDATWNPVRGCDRISPGCMHCYAETFAERFRGVKGHPYEQGFDLRLVPEKLTDPFSWPGPRRVFVNSMSDLFHKDVPVDYIRRVGEVMVQANWHTFLTLTKRSERMRDLLQPGGSLADLAQHSHLWWGVSVENRKHGLPRVDHLRSIPTRGKRFLSVEPLLEDLGELHLTGIDWAIVGGESGHGARPMESDWVRSIRDQCQNNHIAFFFKQWGGRQKSKTGRTLDGREHNDSPPTDERIPPTKDFRQFLIREFKKQKGRENVIAFLANLPAADGWEVEITQPGLRPGQTSSGQHQNSGVSVWVRPTGGEWRLSPHATAYLTARAIESLGWQGFYDSVRD